MLKLYSYYRSGTSYRTRLALNYKGIAYEQAPVDLKAGAQGEPAYLGLNPQGLVPALETPEGLLTQSPAILEWIEETVPEPPLLPADPFSRARVRAVAAIIGCDTHPIQNLRVLKRLMSDHGTDQDAAQGWARHWIAKGFEAVEALIAAEPGPFCFGETPTLADLYIRPQVYNAERFGLDMASYPRIKGAAEAVDAVPALADAHPSKQPDAPAEA